MPLHELDLPTYVAAIRRHLGDPPTRVAESTAVMGVASRLWSATVVPAATQGVLADPSALVARHVDGALALGLRSTTPLPADPATLRAVVLDVLTPVVEALRVSTRMLWANVAASLHAVPRVHGLPRAAPWCADLMASAPLAGHLDVEAGVARRSATCCLFYRVPGAAVCGDCVFDVAPPARRAAG